jgi:hypothetical protein
MSPDEKIEFAYKLLKEVEEEVKAPLGSPPFPELEKIELVTAELSDWLSDHYDASEEELREWADREREADLEADLPEPVLC